MKRVSALIFFSCSCERKIGVSFCMVWLGITRGHSRKHTRRQAAIFSLTMMLGAISSEIRFLITCLSAHKRIFVFWFVSYTLKFYILDSLFIYHICREHTIGSSVCSLYDSPAYYLANFVAMFAGPFGFILPAALAKYYDENRITQVTTVINYSLKYFLISAVPFAIVVSIFSRQILTLLSTPEIAQNGYMVTPYIASSVLCLE